MTAYLPHMDSERRNPALSQWYTPPPLAARVWEWANYNTRPSTVLEPAAGRGALIRPIIARPHSCREVVAVDIDVSNVMALKALMRQCGKAYVALCGDFLTMYQPPVYGGASGAELGGALFDLALMNPPYEDGQAEAFILRALSIAARVVGIFKASILHGQERYRTLWAQAHTTREARLMSRPKFGSGERSESAKSDFVVLEIERGRSEARRIVVEEWP